MEMEVEDVEADRRKVKMKPAADLLGAKEHYDPTTDRQERRELREGFRALILSTEKNKDELVNPSSDGLLKVIEKADVLFEKVKMTREAALDSQLMVLTSKLATQQAQKLQTSFVQLDPTQFRIKLTRMLGGAATEEVADDGDLDLEETPLRKKWAELNNLASKYLGALPRVDFMNGPLEIQVVAKPKRVIQRQKRLDLSQAEKPMTGAELLKAQGDETTQRVRDLNDLLGSYFFSNYGEKDADGKEKDDPLIRIRDDMCFFQCVVNPASFGQTVENIFHLSFLVKDAVVRLFYDDQQLPRLNVVIDGPEAPPNSERRQSVLAFDHGQWKDIVELFGITESFIPHRDEDINEEFYRDQTQPSQRKKGRTQ